jgi:hypothetical protein
MMGAVSHCSELQRPRKKDKMQSSENLASSTDLRCSAQDVAQLGSVEVPVGLPQAARCHRQNGHRDASPRESPLVNRVAKGLLKGGQVG